MFEARCYVEMKMFKTFISKELVKCHNFLKLFLRGNKTMFYCPPNYDGYYCWHSTLSQSTAQLMCPFEHREIMTRWCSDGDAEIVNEFNVNATKIKVRKWHKADYAGCSLVPQGRTGTDIFSLFAFVGQSDNDDSALSWLQDKFSSLDQIGCGLSLVCLIIALTIFTTFRQLQDTRVRVHINLFSAMLLQTFIILTQNFIYGCKIFKTLFDNSLVYDNNRSHLCRVLMTMSHYFELSVFSWLLVEGWYFYSFISRAPYNDFVSIKPHMIIGWGLPILIVTPWVIVHLYTEKTNFCWIDIDVKINIVAVPIFLIVLVNLCFFIVSVRIIFIKMKSTYMSQKRMDYWRWIKSSLMLVPLFGAYDVLYGIWFWVNDQTVKMCCIISVRFICAFQGCIISILYCFANGDVKREIKRAWRNWKQKREINSELTKNHCHSIETLSRLKFSESNVNSTVDLKSFEMGTHHI